MNTDSSSFTREESNFLRVAAAFVTVHHQLVQKNKRPRDDTEKIDSIPLVPSRPTRIPSLDDHIQYMMNMALTEQTGTPRWKSVVHHLAHQLQQWDQTPRWITTQSFEQHTAIWHEMIDINSHYFTPLLVPVLLPQRSNGHVWHLLEAALARAPLHTIQETVQELVTDPPLPDNLAVYYSLNMSGSALLSKWAHDNLLQQLLVRLHEAGTSVGTR